ncbi:MAG: NAD(P)/FAD-dependent oxidoreductase [Candidatus Heimdallarchaeota archaeon]|nr:NAD(P)/FAD-dependent oxidoreductase [Candidatus Heimdallarchaeota archaeon]
MNIDFDLVVLGTGMAGSIIAYKCRSAGLNVAIIDNKPYGGTCALRGCDPKKVLYGATEVLGWVHRMENRGIIANKPKINWNDLMRFKETFVSEVPSDNQKKYEKAGITTFHGSPHFISTNQLKINHDILTSKHIVIATGAKARKLGITGEEHMIDNETFLNLTNLPKIIIFIGGGYISFEFAHIARRAGSDVIIIHKSKRPLKNFEPELVKHLVQASEDIGIRLELNQELSQIEKQKNRFVITTSSGQRLEADLIVHGAGRSPNIDGLDLGIANVEYNAKGIMVTEYLQSTSNPIIYAAGDVAASNGLALTPIAVIEGFAVATNILKGNTKIPSTIGVASVVFTLPSLAKVGLTEEEAKYQGFDYSIKMEDTSDWFSVKRVNEKIAMYKTIIDNDTGLILGAHLLGSDAAEVINLFSMAIQFKIPTNRIRQMVLAYPTNGSDIVYMV